MQNNYDEDMCSYPGAKWKIVQIRMSPDLHKTAQMCLRDDEITMSLFVRTVLKRYINNRAKFGGIEKASQLDGFDKLDRALTEVSRYMPMVRENPYFKRS